MSRQSYSKIMQPRKYLEAFLILAAAFGVVLITVGTQAAFAKVPQFKDYAVRKVHSGQIAQPDLNSHPDAATFRTRLRNAAKGAVNFAGKYVLVQWGCGTTCVFGALLDAENGKIIFLPFTVCCWGDVDDDFRPIEFRLNSRLIVFAGLKGEGGPMGAHFYEFRDDKFIFLETVETAPDFRGGKSKESGAGILSVRPATVPDEPPIDDRLSKKDFVNHGAAAGDDIAGPKAVWESVEGCRDVKPCLREAGARDEAIEFVRALERLGLEPGQLVDFEEYGPVDLAVVETVRANPYWYQLMVNGDPPAISTGDERVWRIAREDNRIRRFAPRINDPLLNFKSRFEGHRWLPGGGQRFVFFDFIAQCPNCEFLGEALLAFDFNADGIFQDVWLMAVMAAMERDLIEAWERTYRPEDLMRNSKLAQRRLVGLGYSLGPIDGVMGQKTRAAVRDFQAEHGLAETGVIDEATANGLAYDATTTIVHSGNQYWVGIWAHNDEWCKRIDLIGNDGGPVRFTPYEFHGVEQSCAITRQETVDEWTRLHMNCSGEGEEWTEIATVSADKNTLRIQSGDGTISHMKKCL